MRAPEKAMRPEFVILRALESKRGRSAPFPRGEGLTREVALRRFVPPPVQHARRFAPGTPMAIDFMAKAAP